MFFPIGKKIDWHRKTGPSPKTKKRFAPVTRNLSSHYPLCSIGLLSPFYFCLFCIVYSSIIRCTELGLCTNVLQSYLLRWVYVLQM